jgi:manganese/zinc/iron transport system permease protein
VSVSGAMATVLGIIFLITYLFAPAKGLISVLIKQHRQKLEFSLLTFLLHIKNHMNGAIEERKTDHLTGHFNWQEKKAKEILEIALNKKLIVIKDSQVSLTPKGVLFASESLGFH